MDDYLIEGAVWQDFSISEDHPPYPQEINAFDGTSDSFFIEDSEVLSFLEELDTKES